MQTSVPVFIAVARVQAWLATTNTRRDDIARAAGVDEKTIRLAKRPKWDPRVSTLGKLEAVIPADFVIEQKPAPKKRRAA